MRLCLVGLLFSPVLLPLLLIWGCARAVVYATEETLTFLNPAFDWLAGD